VGQVPGGPDKARDLDKRTGGLPEESLIGLASPLTELESRPTLAGLS
jgi:hypothetical protein